MKCSKCSVLHTHSMHARLTEALAAAAPAGRARATRARVSPARGRAAACARKQTPQAIAAVGVFSHAESAGCWTELAGERAGGGGAGGWGRRADLVQQRDHLFLAPLLLRLERVRLEAGRQTNTHTNTQANKPFVRQETGEGARARAQVRRWRAEESSVGRETCRSSLCPRRALGAWTTRRGCPRPAHPPADKTAPTRNARVSSSYSAILIGKDHVGPALHVVAQGWAGVEAFANELVDGGSRGRLQFCRFIALHPHACKHGSGGLGALFLRLLHLVFGLEELRH